MMPITSNKATNYRLNREHPVILAYHGVTDTPTNGIVNFAGKHIKADVFREQMAYIKAHHTPVLLSDLQDRLRSGKIQGNLIVVTFDDGYENNFSVAWPILQELGVPATFFLSTGFIGGQRMFWVDQVEYIFNHTDVPSVQVDLPGHDNHCFELRSQRDRIHAVIMTKRVLKRMSPDERRSVLADIRRQAAVDLPADAPQPYACMSWNQINEMGADPLIEFGGHTVNHEILANLTPEDQRDEVLGAHEALKGVNSYRNLFAYPNGRSIDYNAATLQLMHELDYTCATSAEPGFVDLDDDLYQLSRVIVRANDNPHMRNTHAAHTFPFDMERVPVIEEDQQ
ncbi:MAG: polysaccharide deacetylase family protein [Chloroflexi bacterium]|nr:polysaccharide deacetylase family protein [Chloroflexota bacterium]